MDIDSPADRRPTAKAATVLLLVLVASVVAALGASNAGALVPAATLEEGGARALRIAGAAAAVAGLIGLLAQRRRLRSDRRHGPDPTGTGVRAAATIMVVLVALALLRPAVRMESGSGGPVGGTAINPEASGPPPPPSTSAPITEGYTTEQARDRRLGPVVEPGRSRTSSVSEEPRTGPEWAVPPWLDDVLLAFLILAGVVAAARILRSGDAHQEAADLAPDEPLAAAEAEAGLMASLEEIMAPGGDPRRKITAAYHRLLAALSEAGAPREPQEAPHEHLGRTLGPLGVRPQPMHRLAELYVAAQFGERPVTERHREAAVDALRASLAGLPSARPEAAA